MLICKHISFYFNNSQVYKAGFLLTSITHPWMVPQQKFYTFGIIILCRYVFLKNLLNSHKICMSYSCWRPQKQQNHIWKVLVGLKQMHVEFEWVRASIVLAIQFQSLFQDSRLQLVGCGFLSSLWMKFLKF